MQIYVGRDGKREGPFSLDEVRGRLASAQTLPGDLAWYEGAPGWIPVTELPGLNPPPTPATAPVSPAGSVPPPIPSPAGGLAVPGTFAPAPPQESYAIVSLVLGLVGLFVIPFLASIPGAIFGHLALGRIKRSAGELGGRGLAIAGLVISYLGMLLWMAVAALFIVAFAWVATQVVPSRSSQNSSMTRFVDMGALVAAEGVMDACRNYAAAHDGQYPATLEELVPKYLEDPDDLKVQPGGDQGPVGFEYFGGKKTDPADQVLFVSRGTNSAGEKIVGRIGGDVETVRADRVEIPGKNRELENPSKER